MHRTHVLLTSGALLLALIDGVPAAQQSAAPQVTACGKVQKVSCDSKEPYFTTLELKPKSKLPVTIPRPDRAQFTPAPEERYRDTEVCATGHVETYARHKRLMVTAPQDITIRKRIKSPETPWTTLHVYECDEGVESLVLVGEAKPNYTREAMQKRVSGTVGLEAIVNPDGQIGEIHVRRPLDPGLDDQAVRAARQWQFRPPTRKGQPAAVLVQIEMSFTLK